MSKYRYRFEMEMNTAHVCSDEAVFDLVDDGGLDEAELDAMTEKQVEEKASEAWDEWFWNRCNGGWSRIK